MKLAFKTLKNEDFSLDIEMSYTVKEVKEKLEEYKPSDFKSDQLSLICAGKVLEDDKTLSEYKLTPNSFIVVMASKPKVTSDASQTNASTAQPVSSSSTTTTCCSSSATTPSEQTATTVSAETTTTTTGNPLETDDAFFVPSNEARMAMIENIMAMGFDREQVKLALRASFYNADRAVEYLVSGNFPNPEETTEPTESTNNPTPETLPTQHIQITVPPASVLNQQANPFDFLRNDPQFQQLREAIQNNPQSLAAVISQIGQQNPELLRLIQENQVEFINLLNGINTPTVQTEADQERGAETAAAPTIANPNVGFVQINPHEREAINRLKDLGFSEAACVQAYFACDKNENLAANFLLNSNFEDD